MPEETRTKHRKDQGLPRLSFGFFYPAKFWGLQAPKEISPMLVDTLVTSQNETTVVSYLLNRSDAFTGYPHYPVNRAQLQDNRRRGKEAASLTLPRLVLVASKKKNSMVRVRERTIPTERPPLLGEVVANFCG
jgi:hypothetical protein